MFELWIELDGFRMFHVFSSDSLQALKGIELEQIRNGVMTEIRLKAGEL